MIEKTRDTASLPQSIHLIAVCGTGMGALAGMFKDAGFQVSGSDHRVYPPMSTFLEGQGIKIMEGFQPENLSHSPDLVVVGNAVSRDNPEIVRMFEMDLPYLSFPQALNQFFVQDKKLLVVAGTHGKTTTASLLAWIVESAGLDPGFMIGGILKNFGRNYKTGSGPYFIVEGDEACNHYPTVMDLIREGSCRTVTYGLNESAEWCIKDLLFEPPWAQFTVMRHEESFGRFRAPLMGNHNLLNALSVIAVAHDIGLSIQQIAEGLETFEGVKRRQEIRGEKRGVTVIDDFAHHPTAVKETIGAVSAFYPNKRLVAVFEPRSNSSRRNIFQREYSDSFDSADLVCVRKPTLLEKIPVDERFSSERLAADLESRGIDAHYFPDTDAIIEFLEKNLRSDDIVLIMSNGGFDNIHERLLATL
ncbi:MAG: UDP-N-acetylmuramate:L-alanyl-gamma-D-glutamyl-meso-diaminopimelate ligase [Deltaproteobacteria bacterium]|nr:UDP-N-acetylmuramate:L-alanyl-gamma-D-glutamyl-meso-diaminopimelate ligase [Deltaproteobacteria bacterium]